MQRTTEKHESCKLYKYCLTSTLNAPNNKLFTALSAVGNTYQIYSIFFIESQKKKPVLFQSGFRGSVLVLPSLLLFTECFQYYQRFSFFYSIHTTIVSNLSLGHTQSVSHTHLFAHTHVHAHMITDTHNNPTGHMQDTKSCSETHTQPVSMYPWGGAVASVAAWCFISRTTHYYSNTRLFRCSNVLSILLNQLYMPPEGKQFTNTLPLWKNEMTFEWTHYMIILFYSHIMFFFFRGSVEAFPIF